MVVAPGSGRSARRDGRRPAGRRSGNPARSEIRLRRQPASVPEARAFVVDTLTAWHADRYLEVATLLTSELVTNAVVHSGSGEVAVSVSLLDDRLRVDVSDSSPVLPPCRDGAGSRRPKGRGLTLVEALAASWGAERRGDGKAVWFEVAP